MAGVRVRVRFAGRLVDGYVLERGPSSDHDGRLAFLERVVGREPVLTPETTTLFRAVADRYAGSFVDVVRLGVPARHAGAESRPLAPAGPAPAAGPAERLVPIPGRAVIPARPFAIGVRPGPSGQRSPARTGRNGSPRSSPPRSPAGGARWSSFRTPETSPGWTPP